MKYDEFKIWLETRMDARSIASRLSNCRRLETFKHDLDQQFAKDKGRSLIELLEYSAEDERSGREAKHCIPIEGKIRKGTATLKAAANLYFKFAEDQGRPTNGVMPRPDPSPPKPTPSPKGWPVWQHPCDDEILGLAKIVSRYVRFLAPEIVQAVVQDNDSHRDEWLAELKHHGIDESAYLWKGSSCAFPGVRRYAGSEEIAIFRKKASGEGFKIAGALRLDDNDFPKQIWSHVFLGKKFPKYGPDGYALAHLADHKIYGNRHTSDFFVQGKPTELHGLFTAVTNSVYVPLGLIKPTDFGAKLRNLLMRQATALYAATDCKLLPSWITVPADEDPKWALEKFDWAEPVGDSSHIEKFLTYRNKILGEIFAGSRP